MNLTETGTPPHQTTYNETYEEVRLNAEFGSQYLFPTAERQHWFSNRSIVRSYRPWLG